MRDTILSNTAVIIFNIVVILALSIYINEFILTDEVVYKSLGDQLSNDQIASILGMTKRMVWVDYIIAVVGYLLKIILISALIYLILVLNEIKVFYADIIGIVSKSFTIFLVPVVLKVLVFSYSTDPITLDRLQFFSIGSLLNIFDSEGMESWLKVILRSLNIWEVIFIILLAFQLRKYFANDFGKSLSNVLISYGGGLVVWICFAVFISITLSPD
jgi:hypothetical protein